MAWDIACYRGYQFSAFIPASGAFWEPLPNACETSVNLRHTHGTDDGTVPMEGRPIGQYQQGDVEQGIALWRTINGCSDSPDDTVTDNATTCSTWSNCTSGNLLQLCLHEGGHEMPTLFLPDNLDWVESINGKQ